MEIAPLSSPPARSITVARENPRGETATRLLGEMCDELVCRYGRSPSPYHVQEAEHPRAGFVVARLDGVPVGCGALRCLDERTVEVKRMYVTPSGRRRGIARQMLAALERLAADFGYGRIVLETGVFQPEALTLYDGCGYRRTAPYGRYINNPESVCFEKPR